MKKIINTNKAPAPLGPYNQAILAGNTLFVSGQIAIDPKTNQLISTGVEDEAEQVMLNLKAVLEAAGMTFDNVVKSSIFLNDMNDFAKINTIYGAHFDEATAPARETVEVSTLPKNVNVEISMIAVK
ncbi:RidA family protein [Galbibacter pacificus]|uniref:RidA family protein n=1 Tax=Galbibacter pacificus TaxID=2996052 RepID=A0ABT6FPB3_9FLAO|nr:RidA family protein [Galbibacter pacificus]MDG3581623.1 RidA family protein [Galbibacter pacificus]MDG3585101.1 RidA family protein [Galbibacter pacificus]